MSGIFVVPSPGLKRRMQAHRWLRPIIKDMVNAVSLMVQGEARKGAKPHSVDRGEVARSIAAELATDAQPFDGRVHSLLGPVVVGAIERGRRPGGRMPPVDAIADWLRRHASDAPPWAVAISIARKGTKGLFFMKGAFEEGERRVPQFAAAAARKVSQAWRRGV